MTDFFRFTLLGMGAGGLYGLAAIGLVLVYRGSGVVNFAQAALGLAGGYVYYDIRVGWNAPAALALVGAVAVSAALGAAFHLAVMRRMRQASTLAKIVATLALLVVLQDAADLHYGVLPKLVPSMLPVGPVHIFGTAVGADRICILAIVVVLTTILWAVYRYTTFGVETTAVAENPRGAAALAVSPDLVAAVNWAVGGALAGIAVVLLVPITGLGSDNITLLVLPVTAAAVVGRFSSFPLTTITGLAIGVGQSLITLYVAAPGWGTALPFLLVTVVLVVRGGVTNRRSEPSGRLPALGSGRVSPVVVLLGTAGTLLCTWLLGPSWRTAIQVQVVYAIILLSFVVVTGYSGQVSLAQMAFAGIGGMATGWFMIHLHWAFGFALLGGMLATVPVGMLIGLVGARTQGVSLAVVTLGFAVSLAAIVYENFSLMRPFFGISSQHLTVLGINVSPATHPDNYTTLALLIFVGAALVVSNVRRSRVGRRLISVRTNERAAAAMGISVRGVRVYAIGLGSAIAGLGGALLTFQILPAPSFQFPATDSITVLQDAVIGGVGSVAGAPIGATFHPGTLGQHVFSVTGNDVATVTSLVAAIGVLLILTIAPDGLAMVLGGRGRRWRALRPWRPSRPVELPSEPGLRRYCPVLPTTLEIRDLTVRFGGVVALSALSLEVRPAEVVGLIGPNGAGKTTAIEAVTGFVSPAAGAVLVGGAAMGHSSPERRARAGISRSFQGLELFDDLTVLENILAACDRRDRLAYLSDLVWPGAGVLTPAAVAAIEDLGLAGRLESKVGDLNYAERRMLAVARAAACGRPVLLLDEPAAGLDAGQTQRLGDSIRRLATERDMAVLLVEHNVDMVMRTCDRIYVLDFGQLIAHGTPAEIRTDPVVIEAYLGVTEQAGSIAGTGGCCPPM